MARDSVISSGIVLPARTSSSTVSGWKPSRRNRSASIPGRTFASSNLPLSSDSTTRGVPGIVTWTPIMAWPVESRTRPRMPPVPRLPSCAPALAPTNSAAIPGIARQRTVPTKGWSLRMGSVILPIRARERPAGSATVWNTRGTGKSANDLRSPRGVSRSKPNPWLKIKPAMRLARRATGRLSAWAPSSHADLIEPLRQVTPEPWKRCRSCSTVFESRLPPSLR